MKVIQQSITFKPITIELESPSEVFAILDCIRGYRDSEPARDTKKFVPNMAILDKLYADIAKCRA